MVTLRLTPHNADSIPHNIIHLIVTEGVTEIPERVCYDRTSLETIVFSKSVAVIRRRAFKYCSKLRSVIFPSDSQLIEIGVDAFYECISLESIVIPDSVTIIGKSAFSSCKNLKSVTFSDKSSLREIQQVAFYHCNSLVSFSIT